MLRRLFVARLWLVMTLALAPVVGHALDNGFGKDASDGMEQLEQVRM